eukprot:2447313-Rhodomonas_salina.1
MRSLGPRLRCVMHSYTGVMINGGHPHERAAQSAARLPAQRPAAPEPRRPQLPPADTWRSLRRAGALARPSPPRHRPRPRSPARPRPGASRASTAPRPPQRR